MRPSKNQSYAVVFGYLARQLTTALRSFKDLEEAFPGLSPEALYEAHTAALEVRLLLHDLIDKKMEPPPEGTKWVDPELIRRSIGFLEDMTRGVLHERR